MKKYTNIVIGIIGLVVVIVLVFLIFHKPSDTTNNGTNYASLAPKISTSTSSATIIQTKTSSEYGQYLATSSGAALYTYSADRPGVSNCAGSCIASWPVYGPSSSSGTPSSLPANVSIITRSDGTKQYAYNNMPLYTFISDSNGEITGNGVAGFSLAKP